VVACIAKVMRKLRLRSPAELVLFFHEAPGALPSRSEETLRAYAPRPLSATRVRYGGGDYLVLTYPAKRWSLPPCLSISEQRIVLELIAGSSQHAVACRRGTALRTVANQVASIHGKLKVHSRIELFVAVAAQ
jgi:DNA-binding CsgD family transcriptional regulator